ncbi:hypothetical protein V8G54_018042 [Vigna mungo]|uniref:Fanconi-associated nuclease n=1 Tax=Vigna mungo TaxID=3915 RepID=A0AAQ3RUD8_VIGMU
MAGDLRRAVVTLEMVLTGRESLIRLIGRRRRFLPNRRSILSDTIPDPNPNPNPSLNPVVEQPSQQPDQSGDVQCPVCGRNLPGDDHNRINSHLDACLSHSQPKPATKRKLSQRTLLELNFSPSNSRPKLQSLTHESDSASFLPLPNNGCEEEENCDKQEPPEKHETGVISTLVATSSSSSPVNSGVADDFKPVDVLGATLETFIVGRRHADNPDEICAGTAISLLRDPQNVKDPNAVKVVSGDSACCKSLGFLPRHLAQYLSPLIDNYGLGFQGHVTSVPKHSLEIVPIQVTCHKTANGESEYADETFICLWKNVQHVVKFESRNPPSTVKYQLNFFLMLQEALRNNIHLLTEDEKTYMGPWFRMSSISYSEIEDTQKAVKELAEKEYIHFIEGANQLCMSDVKDILNVLNVSELREIWSISLKKGGGHGLKKQHLISSIISRDAGVPWSQLSTMILERSGSCIRISSKSESLMWRTENQFSRIAGICSLMKRYISKFRGVGGLPFLLPYMTLGFQAIEVAQIMDEALDTNKIEVVLRCIKLAESRVSTDFPDRYSTSESVSSIRHLFTASWVYSKVVTVGISFHEQERRYGVFEVY